MNAEPVAGSMGSHLTRPFRGWRIVVIGAAGLLLVGAFLLWGPIGLGNGPLTVEMSASEGGVDQNTSPVGFIVPMYNSGHAAAVVDSVDLVGGTRFPGPRLLRLAVVSDARCGGAWPARSARPGFVMVGCGGGYRGSLIGHAVPYIHGISPGFPAAAEAAPPRAGSCWVSTEVVVHYHVGIRHYTSTDSFEVAVCGRDAANKVNAAMNAAELAPG